MREREGKENKEEKKVVAILDMSQTMLKALPLQHMPHSTFSLTIQNNLNMYKEELHNPIPRATIFLAYFQTQSEGTLFLLFFFCTNERIHC